MLLATYCKAIEALQQLEPNRCSPTVALLLWFSNPLVMEFSYPVCLQMAPSNKAGGSGGGVQGGQPSPAKLLMQLVAAPSMFSLPLCTGRLLSPPFRVQSWHPLLYVAWDNSL